MKPITDCKQQEQVYRQKMSACNVSYRHKRSGPIRSNTTYYKGSSIIKVQKFSSDNYYYSWNILIIPCTTLGTTSLIGKSALQLPTFSGSHIFWPYWLINSVLVILRRPSLHFEGPCKKLTRRRCRLFYCCWLIGGLRESGQTNILQTI